MSNKTVYWYRVGTTILHRLDGPAVIEPDESEYWFQNGQLHRVDGPSVIGPDGTKRWYQNGRFHRLDGPAIKNADGHEEWLVDGKLHRDDGPAVDYAEDAEWVVYGLVSNLPCRRREWWVDGVLHRVSGPAREWENKSEKNEIYKSCEWYQNGLKHRLDGPAIIGIDGSEEWYLFGKVTSQEINGKFEKMLIEYSESKDLPNEVLKVLFEESGIV